MADSNSGLFSFSPDDLINVTDAPARKFKILVIEDDLIQAQEILTTLARAGMECRHTTDGTVGLEALGTHDFHLLLLNLNLRQEDGSEICHHIREISTVPLLVLTQQETQEAQIKYFGLGIDDYLIKPFSAQILLLRVMSLLRRSYHYNRKKHKHKVPLSSLPLAVPAQALQTTQTHSPVPMTDVAPPEVAESAVLPRGWSRCDHCNYMGPTAKFSTTDSNGRPVMACPNCGDKSNIEYALG